MNGGISINIIRPYSVWEYVLRLFAVVIIIFICFITICNSDTVFSGFITATIAFLIVTVAASILLLREKKWIFFFALAYLLHVLIGLFHYLFFIDPSYFLTKGISLPLPDDFTIPLHGVSEIVTSKRYNGLLHYENFYVGHPEIWNLISYPFYFFGVYILNIAPLNSFMSTFASINLLLISKHILQYEPKKLRYVAILAAYFPLTLISSLFYRDPMGIGLMSLGLLLVLFSRKGIFQYLMLFVAIYLFYIQRTIYPIVLLVSFFLDFIINRKDNLSSLKGFISILFFVIVISIMLIWSISLGLSEGENSSYIEGAKTVNYFFLPLKLLMGLVGPFPWFQYYTTGRIEFSYQFADYLQGVFNVTVLFLIVRNVKIAFKSSEFNILNLTGLLLVTLGLLTTFMHISYISAGILFLIPWIVNVSLWNKLKDYYFINFMIMLIFSVFILTVFGGLGLASLWK
jgi:hypothetical protein